jgi:hypothetical protein
VNVTTPIQTGQGQDPFDLDDLDNRFNLSLERINSLLQAIDSNRQEIRSLLRSTNYGLRYEVPFERWYYDHGFQKPVDNFADHISARAWALLDTLEGAVRCIVEIITNLYSQLFSTQDTERHFDILSSQWQGLQLSLLAILSPDSAKKRVYNSQGQPLIGASVHNWEWGTLYACMSNTATAPG